MGSGENEGRPNSLNGVNVEGNPWGSRRQVPRKGPFGSCRVTGLLSLVASTHHSNFCLPCSLPQLSQLEPCPIGRASNWRVAARKRSSANCTQDPGGAGGGVCGTVVYIGVERDGVAGSILVCPELESGSSRDKVSKKITSLTASALSATAGALGSVQGGDEPERRVEHQMMPHSSIEAGEPVSATKLVEVGVNPRGRKTVRPLLDLLTGQMSKIVSFPMSLLRHDARRQRRMEYLDGMRMGLATW